MAFTSTGKRGYILTSSFEVWRMADNTCDRKCCLSWQMMLPMSHFIITYTKKSYMCLITHTSWGRNKVNVTRKHTVARNKRKGSRIMHNVWLNPKHNFSHLLGWPRSFKKCFCLLPGMLTHTCNTSTQEDCHELQASLCYRARLFQSKQPTNHTDK